MKICSILFLILTLLTGSFAQKPTPEVLQKPLDENALKVRQDLAEALSIVENNYIGGKKLDYNDVFKKTIETMLHTLDPHSSYLDPQDTEFFNAQLNAQYFGVGMIIGDLSDEKGNSLGIYVRAPFESSPASRAGLRYGDKIIEINGLSMLGKSRDEVAGYLRGARGSTVKVTIERAGKREMFQIVRDAIPQASIPIAYMIRPGVGFIAMTKSFTQTTSDEFTRAMGDLKRQGMEHLIIDLRDNQGGYARQAKLVAQTFLPRGKTIYTERGRTGRVQKYVSENDSPDKTPIVILVNHQTVSAAEILAGALQDNDRALFAGETTYGKGLIQNTFKVENSAMLILTTARYETPSGRIIQRDYSGSLYEYYADAGAISSENRAKKGAQFKTESGRLIYGGGGITPDLILRSPSPTTSLQSKLNNTIWAFSMDLASGRIAGFEAYKIVRPIIFNYELKETDFPITPALFQAFRNFASEKFQIPPPQIDREREYIVRGMRSELVTAAYGLTTPLRVSNESDDQIKQAVKLLPQAKNLALK